MTKTSATILFFGTEDFSLISLRALVAAGFSIGAVITKPDFRSGRGQKITAPAVKTFALEHDIPVWQPQKLAEVADAIRAFDRPVGVLVSYGKIIPASIIELFSPGIINLHPSLLPKYRGPSPIEAAISHQDGETGISIMQLEARMDAGPVYYQQTIALDGTETQTSLAETLGRLGAEQLVTLLPHIIDGSLPPKPQDESAATYCHLLQKSDALVDPESMTAAQLEAKVRAHFVFPKTKLVWHDQPIIITHAHTASEPKTPLDVRCQDGAFLIVDEVIAPSGKTMAATSFLNGYSTGV